jgi:CDP-diacylglycerol---glycerol-3-phosphate 3-phosphatidyltransferase
MALRSLRRQWAVAALIAILALVAGHYLFSRSSFEPYAGRWLLFAGLAAASMLAILWHVLPRNHPPGEEELFTRFGMGTWLSLLSGLLVAYLAGFLFSPWPTGWMAWMPAALYLASRIIDFFDGYAARMTNHVTEAGAALDIELDGLGLLIAVGLGVQYGQLPAWYLLLAVSRQLFVAGMWWRMRRNKPVYDLPPSENRRITAGCQTGFIAVALWPIVSPPATTLAAVIFATPLAAGFVRDWLVVSGVVDPESTVYLRWRSRTKRTVEHWLPFLARIAGLLVGALILARGAPHFTTWEVYLHSYGLQNLRITVWILASVFTLALLFYVPGIVGRVAAILVITLAALDMQAAGPVPYGNALLLICGIIVLHFGSGCCALWQPEEPFLHRRLGQTEPALK